MEKDRLGAFMDAILAIIMTILVLELEKPTAPTFQAFADLWVSYVTYALSFFWLASMWISLHDAWRHINVISHRTLGLSILLLFFASFQPYMTYLVGKWPESRADELLYGIVILITTLTLYFIYISLAKDNADENESIGFLVYAEKTLRLDILIKIICLLGGFFIWPPITLIGVITAGFYILTARTYALRKKKKENQARMPHEQ
ncbi:MAG: TMEM175 family protein [Eubacteriales bacterium]|nr:TMEM175 family protein [Eubacteriales bacterium]